MKTAFLFPGQGAQSPGMGSDLYVNYDRYREAFDRCEAGAGLDLKAACFKGEGMDGSEAAAKLREGGYTGGIVAFTAAASGGGKRIAQDSGIDRYFSKSVLRKDLAKALLEEFCRR